MWIFAKFRHFYILDFNNKGNNKFTFFIGSIWNENSVKKDNKKSK